jgi:sortase A
MERLRPSKIRIIERLAAGATLLIWLGVILMAAGLTWAYLDVRAEQQAVAQAEQLSFVVVDTATPTASPTASPTATPSPTATNTPLPSTPTPDYMATFVWSGQAKATRRALTPQPTPTATPTFTPTPTPEPSPTPSGPQPASAAPDRIVIDSIDLDAPVVPIGWHVEEQDGQRVSVWDVPEYAAGWHETSVYPGQLGNVVINGHHNIKGEVFRYLIDLEPGARIQLHVGETVYDYTVSEKQILKEKGEPPEVRYQNAQWIAPTEDRRLTLVTCWPYTSNSHRLIIVARPVASHRAP